VGGEVLAEPPAGLVQAGLGRTGRPADLPGGQIGEVVQLDGAPLPAGQARDRGAQHLGAVQVLGGGQPLRRDRMEIFGPVGQQHQRGLPGRGAGYVADDAGQPRAEPVRVAQPPQARERLQERLLHDVIHVVRMRPQPRRESPRPRKAPLNQQRERAGVTGAGPPDQVTVADVHTSKCQPGVPWLPASARHSTVRPGHPHCPKPHVVQPAQRAARHAATSASQAEQCAPNGAVCAPPLLRTRLLRGDPNRRWGAEA
jgi:hypothetical protein